MQATTPLISTQPADLTVVEGKPATFTVAANANGALTYQWQKGGTDIAAATAATLTISAAAASDEGSYDCVIVNTLDGTTASATSSAAKLSVNVPPTITTQPADQTVALGGQATFSVAATGNGTLSYQWQKHGTDIAGATNPDLMVDNLTAADADGYACNVTNTLNGTTTSTLSNTANLTVEAPPSPVVTMNTFVTAGLSTTPASTQDLGPSANYAWNVMNGTITSGQGTSKITFTPGAVGSTVSASVTVTNPWGMGSANADATAVAAALKPLILAPTAAHPGDTWMKALIDSQAGMTYNWSTVNGAATGSITSGQGTTIAGFSAGMSLGAFGLEADVLDAAKDPTSATSNVQVSTGTWIVKDGGPLSQTGTGPCAVVLQNGRVLVAGGATVVASSTTGYLTDSAIYDPGTNRWFQTGKLNVARAFATTTLLNDGTVLVAGGQGTGGVALNTAELYDPATGKWTLLPWTLATARFTHRAILLSTGNVLVLGGQNAGGATATAEIYDASTQKWSAAAAMANARYTFTATVLQSGSILVTGGQPQATVGNTGEVYDPVGNTWTTVAAKMNAARFSHTATLLNDGTVLLAGGKNSLTLATSEVFTLNASAPASSTFTPTTGPLATARLNHTDALLPNGTVMVTGGQGTGATGTYNTTEIYNPSTQTWSTVPTGNLVTGRWFHASVTLNGGKIMVVGGQASDSTIGSEIYDPIAAAWSPAGGMGGGRWDHTSTRLPDGRILIVGGQSAATFSSPALSTAFLYDPSTKTWTQTGSMINPRFRHSATLLPSGKVLVAGGATTTSVSIATAEVWDPMTGLWTATANPMATARSLHTATLLQNGTVLVVGGGTITTPNCDIYDPSTNSWTPTNPLPVGRYSHTATLLGNGQVLIIGGKQSASSMLSDVELYDPASAMWTQETPLGTARGGHTTTLLSNGKFLVAGGTSPNGAFTSTSQTAEIYDPNGSTPPTIPLLTGRSGHTAALLKDGRVMLVGGTTSNVEIYDPTMGPFGQFTGSGSVLANLAGNTIDVIPDGTVEVIGGQGADAITETWHP